MNILGVFNSGTSGILRASRSFGLKSARIAATDLSVVATDIAEADYVSDIVTAKLDVVALEASARTVTIADNLMQELIQNTLKNND